jgi:hypothetical protein
MDNTLNYIYEILKTHDRVVCYPMDENRYELGTKETITYKDVIPIYARELNSSLDLDAYDIESCDIYNNTDCDNYPRCYCHNLLEIWKLEKISDMEYQAKAYLHASKCEGDFIFPFFSKIDYDCEEYELLI